MNQSEWINKFYSSDKLLGKDRKDMKKRLFCPIFAAAVVLTGCGARAGNNISNAHLRSSSIPPASVTSAETTSKETVTSTAVSTSVKSVETSARVSAETEQTALQTQVTTTVAITETVTSAVSQTEPTETTAETAPAYDTFYGVLIDEDCSDFEDPPLHDTPCMFMKECRASGYGLDIKQEDGTWVFYMFDENGQALAWDYLNITERQDGLFVTVTGTWEDNMIKVISIEES